MAFTNRAFRENRSRASISPAVGRVVRLCGKLPTNTFPDAFIVRKHMFPILPEIRVIPVGSLT